jgi:hypothetical protein
MPEPGTCARGPRIGPLKAGAKPPSNSCRSAAGARKAPTFVGQDWGATRRVPSGWTACFPAGCGRPRKARRAFPVSHASKEHPSTPAQPFKRPRIGRVLIVAPSPSPGRTRSIGKPTRRQLRFFPLWSRDSPSPPIGNAPLRISRAGEDPIARKRGNHVFRPIPSPNRGRTLARGVPQREGGRKGRFPLPCRTVNPRLRHQTRPDTHRWRCL